MVLIARRVAHRTARTFGLHVQRWHDPYEDMRRLLEGVSVGNVVDGGAFHGGVALRIAALFPDATVHAFEPQPDTLQVLSANVRMQPRIRVHQAALSNQSGRATFHVNQQPFTSSLLAATEPTSMPQRTNEEVAVTTLDRWATGESIDDVAVLKLDLQGNELAALQGATDLLDQSVKVVLAEVNFVHRYVGGCLFHDVAALLDSHRFRLFRLYEIISESGGAWRQADALFVKASLLNEDVEASQ